MNDYQQGYTAHSNGEPFDASKSKEWQDGWDASRDDDEAIAANPPAKEKPKNV